MKGVVLAGGTGSRLEHLTRVVNKHLLPVGRYPMVYHPLMRLKRAGITQVAVVTSPEHMGPFVTLLGSGQKLGLDLTFRVQEEPGGIAQALGLCEDFVGDNLSVVILGDNILDRGIYDQIAAFQAQGRGARLLLKKVKKPRHYGVPRFEDGQIIEVLEKPANPPSPYAVTGIYFYDREVFNYIRGLTPSKRKELEVSDLNTMYVRRSLLTYGILEGKWGDAGTIKGLQRANKMVRHVRFSELHSKKSK